VILTVILAFLATGCGGDPEDETQTGDEPTSTTECDPDTAVSSPGDGPPAREPSCPPTTASPDGDGGGTLPAPPDRPADLVGEVTEVEDGRVLVEEMPDQPDQGRKAWVAFETDGVWRGEDVVPVSDVAVGQRVSVWTGICAESYPEQCGAEALVIE
jgi:hypothetical protein